MHAIFPYENTPGAYLLAVEDQGYTKMVLLKMAIGNDGRVALWLDAAKIALSLVPLHYYYYHFYTTTVTS